MWWSSRAPNGADALRRSLKEDASATNLIGFAGKSLHQNVRAFMRLSALERRFLVFGLEVAVGFIACAGAILAVFAWTGAGL